MVLSKPRRQPAEVRREQILDAAEVVMLRDGVHRATIADIAEQAGLGKGTVYLQFESKQDLVAGMRARYVARIEDEVRTRIARHESVPEQLSEYVRTFATASTRHSELHHLLFQEAGGDEALAFAALHDLFAKIVRAGDFRVEDLDLAIDYAFGGLHAALAAVAHMPPARRRRAIPRIADLIACTLGPARS